MDKNKLQRCVDAMNKFGDTAFKEKVTLTRHRVPSTGEYIFCGEIDGENYFLGTITEIDNMTIFKNLPRKLFKSTYMWNKYKDGKFNLKEEV